MILAGLEIVFQLPGNGAFWIKVRKRRTLLVDILLQFPDLLWSVEVLWVVFYSP